MLIFMLVPSRLVLSIFTYADVVNAPDSSAVKLVSDRHKLEIIRKGVRVNHRNL